MFTVVLKTFCVSVTQSSLCDNLGPWRALGRFQSFKNLSVSLDLSGIFTLVSFFQEIFCLFVFFGVPELGQIGVILRVSVSFF